MPLSSTFQRRFADIDDDDSYDRIEDDQTAGSRGTTPQSPTTEPQPQPTPSRTGTMTGSPYDPAFMHPFDPARYPLEQQISSDKSEYNRLVAPPPPMSLLQRIKGVVGSMATAGRGERAIEAEATLRDRAAARKQQERENLGGRIDANQRALAQQGLGEERVEAARKSLSERMAMMDEMNRARIAGAMDRTTAQQAGAGERTAAQIGSRESIATGRRGNTIIMGDKTFERIPGADPNDPSQDTWRNIGPASIAATAAGNKEQGSYVPVPDPNDPNRIAGWVNPKSKHFVGVDQIQGISPVAAPGPGGPGGGGATIPAKVVGQTKSRADAANSIMPLIASVRQQLNDPEVLNNLGALSGNWNEIQRRAAGAMPTLNPSERQKVRRFAGTLTSIYSLGGTMHGWRALQVAQEFEKRYGGIPAGPQELLGSMQALEETAKSVMGTGGYGGNQNQPPKGNRITLEQFLKEK